MLLQNKIDNIIANPLMFFSHKLFLVTHQLAEYKSQAV